MKLGTPVYWIASLILIFNQGCYLFCLIKPGEITEDVFEQFLQTNFYEEPEIFSQEVIKKF